MSVIYDCQGLVTHYDFLKIYRIIQYFRNTFKSNMVKNIFKVYKKTTFLLKNKQKKKKHKNLYNE